MFFYIKTILQFVEQNEFSIEHFCTACIIRKPLRSKHCSDCDKCVAKFDHHCPWVDNCVGQNNLKYFVGFLFWTPICLAFYMHGAITCKNNLILTIFHRHFNFFPKFEHELIQITIKHVMPMI